MAPLAVNTVGPPGQTLAVFGVTVNVNAPPIVIDAVVVPAQPALEPVIVYTVVLTGLAVTLIPLGELNVAAGAHV